MAASRSLSALYQAIKSKIEAYLKDADLADDTLLDYVMVLLSNRKVRVCHSLPALCVARPNLPLHPYSSVQGTAG
jgi:hypothetical protein